MDQGVFTKNSFIKAGWGDRLRRQRKRLLHTQTQLAELSKVSVVTYQQYEREEFQPRIGYFNLLAKLGIDMQYVFFDTPETIANLKEGY